MSHLEQEKQGVAEARKQSHLELALGSQNSSMDSRFFYEPMLAGHPEDGDDWPVTLGSKTMKFPIWISSMTGGTAKAGPINKMLALTARKFGLGMGLGSCRAILDSEFHFDDFHLRPILGDELPLFANIGIAQVEQLIENGQTKLLDRLVDRLDADGLIVHVNPLQEWLQPEGDRIQSPPLESIKRLLNDISSPLIVKEVGQGFGPESMRELVQLPLLAVDFGANGGTNFAKLELSRNGQAEDNFKNLVAVGHSAEEMLAMLNQYVQDADLEIRCERVIISGGVTNFLDGYYLIEKSGLPAVYGQAASFLQRAYQSQEVLDVYAEGQTRGLLLARQFLRVK